jgi:CheY-like chemotaxis protein
MSKPPRIVIIEDNEPMSEMIRDYLEGQFAGASISVHRTGEEALAEVKERPDVFLLDYNLDTGNPGALNGIQVMMQLKSKFNAPVIFLTAQERPDIAASIMKHGAHDYVVKNQQSFGKLASSIRQLPGARPQARPASRFWLVLLAVAAAAVTVFLLLR